MARTVADEKKTLRAILSESRDALTTDSAAALSEIIQRRVIESDFYRAASAVVARRVRDSAELHRGAFGILEPSDSADALDPSNFKQIVVCVPGVAFGLE